MTRAEDIKLRIASGHPPANTYVFLMQNFFVPEVTKRVAARTKHKVHFIESYGGSTVKVADTLEGVQSGIVDIGGYNTGFEPSNLPLHAFQVMLPFGTMDPVMSVKIARAVYDKVPYMSKVFEDKYNQRLIAPNTTVRVDPNSPKDAMGLPTGYLKGANFGVATSTAAYPVPFQGQRGGRTYRVAFGFRF